MSESPIRASQNLLSRYEAIISQAHKGREGPDRKLRHVHAPEKLQPGNTAKRVAGIKR